MNRFLSLLAIPLLALAQPGDKVPQAKLSGEVTADGGGALPDVTVNLYPYIPAYYAISPIPPWPDPKLTVTDQQGKFSFNGVVPGTYYIVAERRGYLKQIHGAPPGVAVPIPIAVLATDVSALNIRMIRPGVIAGRVSDKDGEPAPKLPVYAVRWTYANGVRQLQDAGKSAVTNDRGDFRITELPPGRYLVYVAASDLRASREGQPQTSLPTFAPSALDVSGALAVEVSPGGESVANVRLYQERLHSVRGKVVGSSGDPLPAMVLVLPQANTPLLGGGGTTGPPPLLVPYVTRVKADSEGKFELRGLAPGQHRLFAVGGRNLNFWPANLVLGAQYETPAASGDAGFFDVIVKDSDVEDIAIRMSAGAEISLKTRFEGPTAGTPPQVALIPANRVSLGGLYPRFGQTHIVSPGNYFVDVTSRNKHFLKSVRLGGEEFVGRQLYVGGGGAELEVVLAPGAGRVTGSISDGDGRRMGGATVSLWPTVPDLSKLNGGAVVVPSGQDGAFALYNVAPGEYYVAAFEGLTDVGLGQYPAFLARFAGQAERVKVALDGTTMANIKVIPKADVARVVDTLP